MTDPDAAVRMISATEVAWAQPNDTLRTMCALMEEVACGALVVRRRDGSFGVVSERDVVNALAKGANPDDVWAADIMTRTVLTASPDEPIISVAEMMLEAGIRHVVLVDDGSRHDGSKDERGKLAGIVSLRDCAKPLLVEAKATRHRAGASAAG